MIIDIVLATITAILIVLLKLFTLINFALPTEIISAVNYFVGYFGYLKGIFPVETLFNAIIIYINFLITFYIFQIIRWIFAHLPWFGKYQDLPTLEEGSEYKAGESTYGRLFKKKK